MLNINDVPAVPVEITADDLAAEICVWVFDWLKATRAPVGYYQLDPLELNHSHELQPFLLSYLQSKFPRRASCRRPDHLENLPCIPLHKTRVGVLEVPDCLDEIRAFLSVVDDKVRVVLVDRDDHTIAEGLEWQAEKKTTGPASADRP